MNRLDLEEIVALLAVPFAEYGTTSGGNRYATFVGKVDEDSYFAALDFGIEFDGEILLSPPMETRSQAKYWAVIRAEELNGLLGGLI